MDRFYPEIGENNWRDQCNEIASQTNFTDYSMIKQQEAAEDNEFFRRPYDPDCVWNLADNVITSRGDASLLSIMDIGNALRSMSIGDQDRFKFQMSRVLSIARLVEVRCLGLFSGLIEAQRNGREEGAKKKKARREREDMRSELTTAQADIEKAASTLASVRQQYCE